MKRRRRETPAAIEVVDGQAVISIDLAVFEAIVRQRQSPTESYGDILRRVLQAAGPPPNRDTPRSS